MVKDCKYLPENDLKELADKVCVMPSAAASHWRLTRAREGRTLTMSFAHFPRLTRLSECLSPTCEASELLLLLLSALCISLPYVFVCVRHCSCVGLGVGVRGLPTAVGALSLSEAQLRQRPNKALGGGVLVWVHARAKPVMFSQIYHTSLAA